MGKTAVYIFKDSPVPPKHQKPLAYKTLKNDEGRDRQLRCFLWLGRGMGKTAVCIFKVSPHISKASAAAGVQGTKK